MPKKKAARKLSIGTRVRVKPDVCVPEFPDVICGGWTGAVESVIGKSKPDPRYVIAWDDETLARLPDDYERRCEENGLFYRMACLGRADIDVIAD